MPAHPRHRRTGTADPLLKSGRLNFGSTPALLLASVHAFDCMTFDRMTIVVRATNAG
ncbi:hypothetical protein PSAB6_150042 [Paraburkholderia sabiae]|nr:hypothetical protein PSAB6_150042 [Paraburkholderia sabiae]